MVLVQYIVVYGDYPFCEIESIKAVKNGKKLSETVKSYQKLPTAVKAFKDTFLLSTLTYMVAY